LLKSKIILMKKLVLVDGNSLLHRAYHAYPRLTTPTGELVNAVYGFSAILLSVLQKLGPTHVAIAWDVKGPTFRHKAFALYKAKRPAADQDFIDQIGRTKEVVEKLNIPQFGIEGYEADDVIGTLARQASEDEDTEVVIVTGDRDALQLVEGRRVAVFMPANSSYGRNPKGPAIYDEEAVVAKYKMTPKQLIELKGLMGDASDNIPGIRGVGQVTATKLIEMADSIDGIYKKINKLPISAKTKQLLEDGKEAAFQSRELGRIETKVPIELSWEDCRLANYKREEVVKLFEGLQFRSLVDRLPKDTWEEDLEGVFK